MFPELVGHQKPSAHPKLHLLVAIVSGGLPSVSEEVGEKCQLPMFADHHLALHIRPHEGAHFERSSGSDGIRDLGRLLLHQLDIASRAVSSFADPIPDSVELLGPASAAVIGSALRPTSLFEEFGLGRQKLLQQRSLAAQVLWPSSGFHLGEIVVVLADRGCPRLPLVLQLIAAAPTERRSSEQRRPCRLRETKSLHLALGDLQVVVHPAVAWSSLAVQQSRHEVGSLPQSAGSPPAPPLPARFRDGLPPSGAPGRRGRPVRDLADPSLGRTDSTLSNWPHHDGFLLHGY